MGILLLMSRTENTPWRSCSQMFRRQITRLRSIFTHWHEFLQPLTWMRCNPLFSWHISGDRTRNSTCLPSRALSDHIQSASLLSNRLAVGYSLRFNPTSNQWMFFRMINFWNNGEYPFANYQQEWLDFSFQSLWIQPWSKLMRHCNIYTNIQIAYVCEAYTKPEISKVLQRK